MAERCGGGRPDRVRRGHGRAWGARATALLSFVALLAPARGSAQGTIAGVVSASPGDTPIPGAEIRVVGAGRSTSTGDRGEFALTDLPAGVYSVQVRALGWRATALEGLRVHEAATTRVDVELDPSPLALEEVVVRPSDVRLDASVSAGARPLTRRQLDDGPTMGQDLFRAAARLPGVAASEFLATLHVRGASTEELLVRLDGLELVEPFHLKDLGGMLSLVDEGSIGSVTLLPGGLPARIGGGDVSAMDLRTRSASAEGAHTELGLGLASARVQAGGRLGSGGDWMISSRLGYLGFVLSLAQPGFWADPKFYDVFAKTRFRLGTRSELSTHVLRTGEKLAVEDGDLTLTSGWGSTYAWANWDFRPVPSLSARTVVSFGRIDRDRSGGRSLEASPAPLTVSDVRTLDVASARQRWNLRPSDAFGVEWGWRAGASRARYDYERVEHGAGEPERALFDRWATETGVHGTLELRPFSPLALDAGVRWDHRAPERRARFSPRLGATLGDETSLRVAWGRHWQPQALHELEVQDGVHVLDVDQGAEQLVVGVAHRVAGALRVRVDAYRRRTSDPRPYHLNLDPNFDLFPESMGDRFLLAPTEGRARGIELLLETAGAGPIRWTVSYVLSSAEDRVAGVWLPRPWDQRHAFSGEIAWRSSDAWSLSLSGRYHTGWPATPHEVVRAYRSGTLDPMQVAEKVNSARLGDYRRVDLRFTRAVAVAGSRLDLFVDVFNALGHRNMRRLPTPEAPGPEGSRFMDRYLPRTGAIGLTLRF